MQLLGRPTISGVDCGDRQLTADLVVSAVGDVPNTDWLAGSSPVEAHDRPVAAAAVNHRMPIVKLK